MTGEEASPAPLVSPPGYSALVPLDRSVHRGLGQRAHAARFAATLNAIYLTVPEFIAAARHYPIVFAPAPGGALHPFALVGPGPGRNLFVDEAGDWRAEAYCPAYVRRYPFATVRVDDHGVGKSLVCVDPAGLDATPPHLFDARGEPGAWWQARLRLIEEFDEAQTQTLAFCRTVEALGVLEAFEADLNPDSGQRVRLTGTWRVDEDALRALPGERLAALVRDGTLPRIYAHLMSLDNYTRLLGPN